MSPDPQWRLVSGISVSADLKRSGGALEVDVVLSRAPGAPRVQGEDVSVAVTDANGRVLEVLDRPSGPLLETGGGLGTVAHAAFRLRVTDAEPAEFQISYKGETAKFRIVSA